MFAALVLDRDPWTWNDVIPGAMVWFQVVGGFSLLSILIFLLVGWPRMRRQDRENVPAFKRLLFIACTLVGAVCYAVAGIFALLSIGRDPGEKVGRFAAGGYESMMTVGGVCCVLAVAIAFVPGLVSLRWRRIYALAKLSFKEAVRRKVLYVFAAAFLIFLFPTWFLLDTKQEDLVRTYVDLVFIIMSFVLVPAALLISAFSIPGDVKNQTIHTVVTKPVERFEILLGRFLGFLALMTVVLFVFTAVSLGYVWRQLPPAAVDESVKYRVPLWGVLRFENTGSEKEGINVGREWDYRSYITKNPGSEKQQTARWNFQSVPSSLADRKTVRFEYTFDVYRTTKGQEGEDVRCVVKFYTWRYEPGNDKEFTKERKEVRDPKRDNALAEKWGYFEIQGLPVTDFHVQGFEVPGGLFANAAATDPNKKRGDAPDLRVDVTCDSVTQYVGMARHDLYARLDTAEGADQLGFSLNFFKAAFGLWLLLALVIGLSVVLSSYLSGVITLLAVVTLFVCGLVLPFVESVALGKNDGGGPAESILRIYRRELSAAKLDESASTPDKAATYADESFRWVVRRIFKIFPDVKPLNEPRTYVAEGHAVPWTHMGLSFLLLVGYLGPWFVLGYFAIRWREIAGAT